MTKPEKHQKAVESVREAVLALGFSVEAVTPSPIRGAAGNQEFFLLAKDVSP